MTWWQGGGWPFVHFLSASRRHFRPTSRLGALLRAVVVLAFVATEGGKGGGARQKLRGRAWRAGRRCTRAYRLARLPPPTLPRLRFAPEPLLLQHGKERDKQRGL